MTGVQTCALPILLHLLQMEHAAHHATLRTTNTLEALEGCVDVGVLEAKDAQTLRAAWLMASSVRDAIVLVKARPGDMMPSDVNELAAIAAVLGRRGASVDQLRDDYLRVTRRARAVMERIFYGEE